MSRFEPIFQQFPVPLKVPTRTGRGGPNLVRKPAVILFDIYGTLIAPHQGDLEQQLQARQTAAGFIATARHFGWTETVGRQWQQRFFEAIEHEHQHCRALGITRAEVLVERIWTQLIQESDSLDLPAQPEEVALYRELTANPVALFSGVREALDSLKRRGIQLGLASNSQFYTGPILERLLAGSLDHWFDRDWMFLSYQLGFAKPDPHFFRLIRTRALRCGYEPDQVLMVGNDLENDIRAAMRQGLQAVHFIRQSLPETTDGNTGIPFVHDFQSLLELVSNR